PIVVEPISWVYQSQIAVTTFQQMLCGQISCRHGWQDDGASVLDWFDGVQHNIVYPHLLCQRDIVGSDTACGGKNAQWATCKDLQQEFVHLLGGETVAKVHDRGVPVAKCVLLQRDDQLSAMDREGKVDDDA